MPLVVTSIIVRALRLMLDGLIKTLMSNLRRVERFWGAVDSFIERILFSMR
jgi:hypothetical protein